jgi:hypothetical protein
MLRFILFRLLVAAAVTGAGLAVASAAFGAEPQPRPGPAVRCRPVPGAVWRSEPGPGGTTVLRRATRCVLTPAPKPR